MFEKDRKNKVIKKFLNLLDRGHGIEYCLKKFPHYRKDLESYLQILKSLENAGDIKDNKRLEDSILEKIYKSSTRSNKIHENDYNIGRIRVRPAFLKPVIVFLSVFMFFSLSFAGTVYASSNSLPGDVLYNVKKTYEDIQIAFTPYANEGKLYFNFLNKRIYEADSLLGRDNIDKETIEKLLGEIDYNYAKCMEHNSFSKNEGERIGKNINELRETFQKRWHKSPNSNGQKANDGNQNSDQTQNNTTQNTTEKINNNVQNSEQYQNDSSQNMNHQHGNNSQDTGTSRFIKNNI
ncbi:MAG: DUF5667 domain-containing protein [Actinomycetota bacterium]|nr:DUF5667 domain-containing protein [Actinomycetota bacterium]